MYSIVTADNEEIKKAKMLSNENMTQQVLFSSSFFTIWFKIKIWN